MAQRFDVTVTAKEQIDTDHDLDHHLQPFLAMYLTILL